MVQDTEYLYIVRDDQILHGEPIIKGTRTPVRAIVETWHMGIAPEEIPKRQLFSNKLRNIFHLLNYLLF